MTMVLINYVNSRGLVRLRIYSLARAVTVHSYSLELDKLLAKCRTSSLARWLHACIRSVVQEKVLLSCVMTRSIMVRNNYGPISLSAATHFPSTVTLFSCQLSPISLSTASHFPPAVTNFRQLSPISLPAVTYFLPAVSYFP